MTGLFPSCLENAYFPHQGCKSGDKLLEENFWRNDYKEPVVDDSSPRLHRQLMNEGERRVRSIYNKTADVVITGEAFSEFGMCKGNLIVCRAWVEIKAIRSENGKLLAVDRQTSAGGGSHGKCSWETAFQKASRKLLDRIIVRLIPA